MDKVEHSWNILLANLEWIRGSDTKATTILTVLGIIIPLFITSEQNLVNTFTDDWLIIVLLFAGLFSIISIFFSFKCLMPRFVKSPTPSILFFGSIVKNFRNYHEYTDFLKERNLSKDTMEEELAELIYTNAAIADRKYRDVLWSFRFFVLTILLALVAFLISLFLMV